MSAMMAVIQSDRVHLVADGAFYDDETGVLLGVENKLWAIPGINAAFCSRGVALAFPAFQSACEAHLYTSFDEFTAQLDSIFAAYDEHSFWAAGEILIAGWSESLGQPVVLFRHVGGSYADMTADQVYIFKTGCVQFGLGPENLPSAEQFDPALHAVPIFEVARRFEFDLSCGGADAPVMGYAIGGALTHLEITSTGCAGSLLKNWPDVLGERINPFSSDVPPVSMEVKETVARCCG